MNLNEKIPEIMKKDWMVVLLLIIFPPLGLFLMFYLKKFSNNIRIVISVVAAVLFLIVILPEKKSDNSFRGSKYKSSSKKEYKQEEPVKLEPLPAYTVLSKINTTHMGTLVEVAIPIYTKNTPESALKSACIQIAQKESANSVFIFNSYMAMKAQYSASVMNSNPSLKDGFIEQYEKGVLKKITY